ADAASESRSSAHPAQEPGGERYRVQANDTLWHIASSHRPASSVSVQQTMLAIQKMNPDAFIKNNVNLVRPGAVLRLPGESQVRDISSRQALARIADQNRAWQQMLARSDAGQPGPAPVDASADGDRDGAPGAAEEQGRVTLVTPESR
ncbi:FimV/HubP family polar landmark protein, partial [Acinetobacter baumannii]|uniref:FimV/HubP family polar landmark protein n=1 Tax=Acinetobacter baumannii TaxID=470 RepID=UPI00189ACE3E